MDEDESGPRFFDYGLGVLRWGPDCRCYGWELKGAPVTRMSDGGVSLLPTLKTPLCTHTAGA
jgi:hypothetical protein